MEKRNIQGFERAHPGVKFPYYRSLSSQEMTKIQDDLKEKLGLGKGVDDLELVKALARLAKPFSGYDADDDDFSLYKCIDELGITPRERVFINFYRFDDIDEMQLMDVDKFFKYIWYPASDDIDIFDSSLLWVISISHDGEISLYSDPGPYATTQ